MRKVEIFNQKGISEGFGSFHRWGEEYEEFENDVGNCTIAIVELDDGSIKTFLPHQIKFENEKCEIMESNYQVNKKTRCCLCGLMVTNMTQHRKYCKA